MPLMNPLYRFYMLPLLVLSVGILSNWFVFKYEYTQENAQFQVEYEFRAQGHTAAFKLGFQSISNSALVLAGFLEHEMSAGEINTLGSKQAFNKVTQLFLSGNATIYDVMWYKSSNDLTNNKAAPWVQALHAESLWNKHRMNSVPEIISLLNKVVKSRTATRIIMQQGEHQPWLYEIIPMMKVDGTLSWLIVSWNIGAAVDSILAGLPVSAQDILFEFGENVDIKLDEKMQGGLQGTFAKASYFHASRSRYNDLFNNNKFFLKDQRIFQWSEQVIILGRTWHIRYDSAPKFLMTHPVSNAWNVFYGGLTMSALLALLTLLIYRRTRLIQSLVQVRTRELSQAQQRIQLLLDSIAEGVFDMNVQGHCTFVNQRTLDMLGFDRMDQLIGKGIHELVHHSYPAGDTMPKEDCRIAAVLQSGESIAVTDEVFWRADGTSFEVAYHATPVRDNAQKLVGIVVTFLDISSQCIADRECEEMRKKVEHTQRLESLGVLAGGIAHDFNNLLTSIIGNTDLALYYLDEASPARKHLQRVDKASQHAADLCQQMLAYSGQGQFVMASLNLSELVQDIGKLLDVSMSKLVSLHYHLASPMALMHADQSQIQQVAMNLLINANEAMGDQEGKIIVTTGMMCPSSDFLAKCYLKPDKQADHYVFFEVDDNACGMDEDTIERMFEPFFTTKFTGRGLGMSAVLGIVRAHDGAMFIDSMVGKGTRMRVLFPALKEKDSAPSLADAASVTTGASDSSHSGGFILVVDDEESLRDIAGMMLEEMGYRVLFAENGVQALEVFTEHMEDIDLVLLDLTMPKMGGEACLKHLKHMQAGVRVLLTSGYSSAIKNTLFEHFLPKPYSRLELEEKIAELLEV